MTRRHSGHRGQGSPSRRLRYHIEIVVSLLLSILLLVRDPHRLPLLLQAEADGTETPGDQGSGAASAQAANASLTGSALSEAQENSEASNAPAADSRLSPAASPAQPVVDEAEGAAPSKVAEPKTKETPSTTAEHSDGPETPARASIPRSASPAVSKPRQGKRVGTKGRKRPKKHDDSRRAGACGAKRCFYFADSAFVSSAHLLPPPPPFTPPSTPEGKAFLRAVELCHVSHFNLNVGKQYVYLMSSAVTYFQQSRVKCAIAYAKLFREEDVPIPTEETLDACAVALLRYSPDDCWIDVPDPRIGFIQGAPGTKLQEPPARPKSKKEPLDEAAERQLRQFKRAERLTLTLFKFSLVSRCHWCPRYQKADTPVKELPIPDLLPPKDYEGPKHGAWRKYLDALNEEVSHDLLGLPHPPRKEGSGESSPAEKDDTSSNGTPTRTDEDNAKNVLSSAHLSVAPQWNDSDGQPFVSSWNSRGRTSVTEGEEDTVQDGYTGLGSIPAGAVFGGLTNPISRYAALLSYMQSRYRFKRLKYGIEEEEAPPPRGIGAAAAAAKAVTPWRGTTQTLNLQQFDPENPFAGAQFQNTASGTQVITLDPSTARAITAPPQKRGSSCDLMPQDQAAEAAKAALACGARCVDTGEDLNKILRDGTDAPASDFADTYWSQNSTAAWPVRLPRHPTAESLQRAYLNQLVSGCARSRIRLSEAEPFYFAQAASLHFFGRFHERCLRAMDEMTLPLFMRAFSDESRGRRVGMAALQDYLPVPVPYSGADQLLVNCAAAALVAGAIPTASLSTAAASAEAIAAAAAAAGAPTWGAPTIKTRAALAASAFAYHHPVHGLTGRSRFMPSIQCWEQDVTRTPLGMSQSEFRAVVTSFTDLEMRAIPVPSRRFLDEHLVPTVLKSLLKEKIPARIFLGYKSPAARAFVLARYMRARFKLDTPKDAGWNQLPPRGLSVEDQTIKAAEVAVNCGLACTDTGQSIGALLRDGVEGYKKSKMRNKEDDDAGTRNGGSPDYDSDESAAEFDVHNVTPIDELVAATRVSPQKHEKAPDTAHTLVGSFLSPLQDAGHSYLAVNRASWIPVACSLALAFR